MCLGFVVLALAFSSAAAAEDNPLVGQWEPAAKQPNKEVARNVDKLGRMEITATHLAVFGESPVAYNYEQDGQVFHIKVNNAMALVLQHGQQHAVCWLIGNPQESQTGRSDCRRIN